VENRDRDRLTVKVQLIGHPVVSRPMTSKNLGNGSGHELAVP
jgi:hypothetical protein